MGSERVWHGVLWKSRGGNLKGSSRNLQVENGKVVIQAEGMPKWLCVSDLRKCNWPCTGQMTNVNIQNS